MPALFAKLDKLRPIYDVCEKVTMFVCKLLLVADILITGMAVLGRYVPFVPDPAWSEEIVLTCMAYMAVLSAAIALRHNTHIRMSAFDKMLPPKLVLSLDVLADLSVMAFAVVMIKVGLAYSLKIGKFGTYTSIPTLSKFWMYFPVPLAGFAMIVFEIETVYNHIKGFFQKGCEAK